MESVELTGFFPAPALASVTISSGLIVHSTLGASGVEVAYKAFTDLKMPC